MGLKPAVKRYETRSKTAGTEVASSKSRVDWRRTRRALVLLDSNDESSATSEEEEESAASESEIDEKDQTAVGSSPSDQEEKDHSGEVEEHGDDEPVVPGKRKRLSTSVMYDSDESEGSDILVRRVSAKRRCIVDDDENSEEQWPDKTCPTENVSTSRKRKVLAKLKELVRQSATRRSCSSVNCEDSNSEASVEEPFCQLPLTPSEGSETDGDSMKDFIVEEDENDDGDDIDNTEHVKNENQPHQKQPNPSNSELLAHYIPQLSRCDHYVHFKRIVKAFLINAIDDSFLSSLYDGTRQKKYAQEMLLSLHYLDDRFIQPRLENLICRSRWKDRYKDRVDCYPAVRISLQNAENMSCQACELKRWCKFNVLLSGRLYNSKTLEVDDFMSEDKQVRFVQHWVTRFANSVPALPLALQRSTCTPNSSCLL
ncbi:coiled-coil domain-containing protein 82 isoform X2 [Anomalospiza imberbis]|uniref:coiled-coil domain-containing protein 82 isoform X2 n=1 Tax=Anomalospiza imberbis TaxID=187417 RepID=UPI00358FF64E